MGPWAVLGIAPTHDQEAIRRAYAERLKLTRPDADADGFRALRAAFEQARGLAGQIEWIEENDPALAAGFVEDFEEDDADEDDASVEERAPVVPPSPSAATAIRALVAAGRLVTAAQAWSEAVAAGEIRMREQTELQEEVAAAARDSPGLTLAALDRLATLMEWDSVARDFAASDAVLEALRRRAAEAWFAMLCAEAAARPDRLARAWRKRRAGARLLLRPAPAPGRLPYVIGAPNLPYWLAVLPSHRRFLGDRLDDRRIGWCLQTQRRPDARAVAWLWRYFVMMQALAVAATVIALIVQALGPAPGP